MKGGRINGLGLGMPAVQEASGSISSTTQKRKSEQEASGSLKNHLCLKS